MFSCAQCNELIGLWSELAKNFDKTSDIIMAKADCNTELDLCAGRNLTPYLIHNQSTLLLYIALDKRINFDIHFSWVS